MSVLLAPDAVLEEHIRSLGEALCRRGMYCATAESCTGGLVGASLSSVPGASAWFAGGIIAYANAVKVGVLGVEEAVLQTQGAVSAPVVRQMARGACRVLRVGASVSLSGVAGPDGGTPQKPVGLVWLGFCVGEHTDAVALHLSGTREEIRAAAVRMAVQELLGRLH